MSHSFPGFYWVLAGGKISYITITLSRAEAEVLLIYICKIEDLELLIFFHKWIVIILIELAF